jgi:uncharacterized membrane protein
MTRVQREVQIDRPAEEVFAFLADGSNNPSWQPRVIETIQVDTPLGVGTRFHQTVRHPLGFRVSADYVLTVYEPGHELALRTTSGGPIRPTQHYHLTADTTTSTTVRSCLEYRPEGLARGAYPLFALLRPLFSWEASWLDRAGDVLGEAAEDARRPLAPAPGTGTS